jgi:hypothetical protein
MLLEALFMQISGVSLTLTWPHRLCLLRVLLGVTATATSFPLPKHTGGGGTTPTFSGWRVYLQFMWEVLLPRFPWGFPHTATFASFPTPRLLGGPTTPAFSSWLVYLHFWKGLPLPTSLALRAPCPLCYVSFVVVVAVYSVCFFLFFPWVGVSLTRGLCWSGPRVVCGSTECRLAHLVVCFSRAGRSWHLAVQEPPGFSI